MTRPTYDLTGWVFLRLVAVVYAIAFASLGVQVLGLIGSQGILPAGEYLAAARSTLGAEAPWRLPTLCWLLGTDDAVLLALCWAGVGTAALLAAGVLPGLMALTAWLLYLSLTVVGQVFLNFQWDALLLETGLLACLAAPWGVCGRPAATPRLVVWALWLLVFKLNFMSGVVKLASGDQTWWSLRALEYHYWTTCLPTWTGWYAHQLPPWMHRASAAAMFAVELLVPFGIVGPRRLRHLAAVLLIGLQVGIALTGNYGFFNLLTVALCCTLFDDSIWRRILPARIAATPVVGAPAMGAGLRAAGALALSIVSLVVISQRLLGGSWVPAPVDDALAMIRPLRSVNGYGLFANMTTVRPEIVIEGTTDGVSWHPYEFRWKPGDPGRRPRFVQPHMPRLDWQMWFAALQGPRRTLWFRSLLARLSTGSPAVLALLAEDPFHGTRPRQLRALLYSYQFTTRAERGVDGPWWTRRLAGSYGPPYPASP